MINEQLVEYIKEQNQKGFSRDAIKNILLDNEWQDADIESAFMSLGLTKEASIANEGASVSEPALAMGTHKSTDPYTREKLTLDKIIEKFIPIVGAIFLIVGLGYLLYANAWIHFPMEIRLGLGFFLSIAIIGGSFSLAEKMRYFADIGIGSGVLLMYATLIYGSRTTELATAAIPEVVTLITAIFFTVAVSYFASMRNSKVILILGMIGAYITPFVIGQNDVWAQNISFNAYLIYFLATNVSVFMIGREISVRDIIPLNIIGLFLGVSTLWSLSYTDGISNVVAGNLFTGEFFTAILFLVLVIFSVWSILLSAKRFNENDDGFLSLGYIAPIIWFVFNIESLESLSDITVGILYVIIATSCFVGWYSLMGEKTRFQHTALYAAGLLSLIMGFFTIIEEMNIVTSMFIAYSSLIFAVLHVLDSSKTERFVSYCVVSFIGSILSLQYIVDANTEFETLLVVVALIPAMSAYIVANKGTIKSFVPFAKLYSFSAFIVAAMFVLDEFIEYVDMEFLMFYLVPLSILVFMAYTYRTTEMSHDAKSTLLKFVLAWFALAFISVFFYLVGSIYPAPVNTFLFTHPERPVDWILIKGIFATAILFVGLYLSRRLQTEQVIKRPSFILVIFGFSTLLLTGNYIIYAIMNDLQVSMAEGGPRAIATTVWWVAIAIYMLFVGVKFGKKYHAEKLLGLLLLGLSVGKIILYDVVTMGMQNKIIVLMLIGGAMLMSSYYMRSKDMIKTSDN